MHAELLIDCRNTLGEGIRWHALTQRLYWVDIQQSQLWSCDAEGLNQQHWQLPERIAALAFTASDKLLLALASGFAYFHPDTGAIERIHDFEPTKPTTRLNDGTTDRSGNFICGGMDELNMDRISSVVHLSGNGDLTTLIESVGCSNSLALSKDGRTLYFADTAADRIYQFDYDATEAKVRNGQLFATLPPDSGKPDGSTVDDEDHLWNAHWGGGRVTRYDTLGNPNMVVQLPVSQVTCCTFGGPNLDRLYITTAREDLDEHELNEQPLAGGLFVCTPGCQGIEPQNYMEIIK